MNIQVNIAEAYQNIRNDIYKTPLIYSPELSERTNAEVFLKMEHLQKTGSFKIRGVLNKLRSVKKEDLDNIFVAASTGNHAAAFCYAAKRFGFKGVLFLPETISRAKLCALESSKVKKIISGKCCADAEKEAILYSQKHNRLLVHPYNDIEIISGQGTLGLELEQEFSKVDNILVPVGGGGLISGVAAWFSENNKVKITGCQPINASEMADSVKSGKIVPPAKTTTIADASAGGIIENSVTFDFCCKYVEDFSLVTEKEIKKAVAFMAVYHHTLIEPAAALPVASILKKENIAGKTVVLVLTGKKINPDLLTNIMSNYGRDN